MFNSKAELIEWLERNGFWQLSNGSWYFSGRYDLSHGEYERPDYTLRKYRCGWSLHAKYYYFPGTFYAKEDGRVCDDFFMEMT